jgi:GntR family transcriptional regulator
MFSIEINSGIPIYRQVYDQLVRQIAHGQIETGQMLPSVRQLASELGVNPMTVSKAYGLLEVDGIVRRKRGLGMEVVKKSEPPDEIIKDAIVRLVKDAKQLGLSETQLKQQIQKHWRRK